MKKHRINVLVTGVCSNVGQGIAKCLQDSHLDLRIIGTSVFTMGSGLYLYDVGYVVPYASDERFIPEIIRICNSENVQLILVGVDAEVAVFSKFKDLIETKTKAKIVSSSQELTETFTDKFETYNYFLARNIAVPATIIPKDIEKTRNFCREIGFPIISKPRFGQGSKSVEILSNWQDVSRYIGNLEIVLQEYISSPEDEFTCAVYADKHACLKRSCSRKRVA